MAETDITITTGGDMPIPADSWSDQLNQVVLTTQQGHAFTMEAQRHAYNEGRVGYREGLSHRIISESGAGQSRAQLPAGAGGVPTSTG